MLSLSIWDVNTHRWVLVIKNDMNIQVCGARYQDIRKGIQDVDLTSRILQLDRTWNIWTYIIVYCYVHEMKSKLLTKRVSLTVFFCDFIDRIIKQWGSNKASRSTWDIA